MGIRADVADQLVYTWSCEFSRFVSFGSQASATQGKANSEEIRGAPESLPDRENCTSDLEGGFQPGLTERAADPNLTVGSERVPTSDRVLPCIGCWDRTGWRSAR